MCEFIFESGCTVKDVAVKKTIRSQAMRNFKEKQRQAGPRDGLTSVSWKKNHHVRGTLSAARPLLPAPERAQKLLRETRWLSEATKQDMCPEQADVHDLDRIFNDAGNERRDITGTDMPVIRFPEVSDHRVRHQQLNYAFLTSYYPDSIVATVYEGVNNLSPAAITSKTLNVAWNALCLIHLGTQFRDDRVLDEGRKLHCVGLHLLREEIEKREAITSDSLLDACYTLAHCQIYKMVSHRGKGWQVHVDGLLLLLQRRGVKSIKSPFARATLHKIRQIAAMDQLLRRKRSFLSSPEWLMSRLQQDWCIHTPALQLTDLALQISGALEDTDTALQNWTAGERVSTQDVREISLHIQTLEHELGQWLFQFYCRSGVAQMPYKLLDVDEFPLFEAQCSDMAMLFPRVYDFPNLLSATTHTYIFILYLAIRMAQLDLASLDSTQLATDSDALAVEAEEYASHLCKSLAYLSLQQHRSAGVLACSGPLHWASAWYERSRDIKKLQTCQSIREAFERDCPTPLNLKAPVFTWWMMPRIFEDQGAVAVRALSGFIGGSPDLVTGSTAESEPSFGSQSSLWNV